MEIRGQVKPQRIQALVNKPCCLAPVGLPGSVSGGTLDLRDVLLTVEVQVRQIPRRAFAPANGLDRSDEHADIVTEIGPRHQASIGRRNNDGSDNTAPGL